MRAVVIEEFGALPIVRAVDAPRCEPDGVVLTVEATGLCRSDWHAWQGHDPDVRLPHVGGHEIAGTIREIGADVRSWSVGARVTVPFVCACGMCSECRSGNAQTCLNQQQPGFSYWGSFAEQVAVPNADFNLVALPAELDFDAAAALGCRLATAYRAVLHIARVADTERVVVFGCGGVGLSAIAIAAASGATVIAVDRSQRSLAAARDHGAAYVLAICDRPQPADWALLATQIRDLTADPGRSRGADGSVRSGGAPGGVDVTIDAVGSPAVVAAALSVLRPRGRHVQIGLLPGDSVLPLGPIVSGELQVLGSHGMAASGYPELLAEIAAGHLTPAGLLTSRITLSAVPDALRRMEHESAGGIVVIHPQSG